MAGQTERRATSEELGGKRPVDAVASKLLEGLTSAPISPLDVLTNYSQNLESNSQVFAPTRPTVLFHERTPDEAAAGIKTFGKVKEMMEGSKKSDAVNWSVIPADAVREVVLKMATEDFLGKRELSFGKGVRYEVAHNGSLWALGEYVQKQTGAGPDQVVEVLLRDLSLYSENIAEGSKLGSIATLPGQEAEVRDTNPDLIGELIAFVNATGGVIDTGAIPTELLNRIRTFPGGLEGALDVLARRTARERGAESAASEPQPSDLGRNTAGGMAVEVSPQDFRSHDRGTSSDVRAASVSKKDPSKRRGGTPRKSDEETLRELQTFMGIHGSNIRSRDMPASLYRRLRELGGLVTAKQMLKGAGEESKNEDGGPNGPDTTTPLVDMSLLTGRAEMILPVAAISIFDARYRPDPAHAAVTFPKLAAATIIEADKTRQRGERVPGGIIRDIRIGNVRANVTDFGSFANCSENPQQMNVTGEARQHAIKHICTGCVANSACFAEGAQTAIQALAEAKEGEATIAVVQRAVPGVRGGMTSVELYAAVTDPELVPYTTRTVKDVAGARPFQDGIYNALAEQHRGK